VYYADLKSALLAPERDPRIDSGRAERGQTASSHAPMRGATAIARRSRRA